jgi:hypothetical protein
MAALNLSIIDGTNIQVWVFNSQPHKYHLRLIIIEDKNMLNYGPPLDGVIKYKFTLKRENSLPEDEILPLEKWRTLLFRMNLIGEYPNERIGYGNISVRSTLRPDTFIITGSQTGHLSQLMKNHYVRVTHCDIPKMKVTAEGLIPPSSECMSHFAIYQTNPSIKCVIHIHHNELWQDLIQKNIPLTMSEYGTSEIAQDISLIVEGKKSGYFATKEHMDGIFAYGEDSQSAGQIILNLMKELRTK